MSSPAGTAPIIMLSVSRGAHWEFRSLQYRARTARVIASPDEIGTWQSHRLWIAGGQVYNGIKDRERSTAIGANSDVWGGWSARKRGE